MINSLITMLVNNNLGIIIMQTYVIFVVPFVVVVSSESESPVSISGRYRYRYSLIVFLAFFSSPFSKKFVLTMYFWRLFTYTLIFLINFFLVYLFIFYFVFFLFFSY